MAAQLTEQTYRQRRADLVNQIRVAKDDHARAALNLELGHEKDGGVVSRARDAITSLEDRVLGLDAAWAQACADAANADASSAVAERKAAVATVTKALQARKRALAAIEKAMHPLTDAVEAFRAANDAVVAAVKPHSRLLGRDGLQFLRSTTHPPLGLDQRIISGMMWKADININGADGRPFATQLDERGGVGNLVDYDNREIERLIDGLVEEAADA